MLPRHTMGQDWPKCKETPSQILSILKFLVLMYPYGSLWVPLVSKSHDTLVELFRFARYVERNKVHFAPFLRFHQNHYIVFPDFGPLVDKQQKIGENVENIKFSLDTQLKFMFSTCSPVFVIYPLEGLRFLYIFGDPGLLCATASCIDKPHHWWSCLYFFAEMNQLDSNPGPFITTVFTSIHKTTVSTPSTG